MSSRLIHRTWPHRPTSVVAARGCTIRTADGRDLLDASSGALAATLGYGVESIADAVAAQVRALPFVHSGRFTSEVAESYAHELATMLPLGDDSGESRWFFTAGGSEAVEVAIALAYRIQVARGQGQRHLLLARHLSYHGTTLATLATGARSPLRTLVAPLLPSVAHVPPPYPYRPEWGRTFPGAVAGVPGADGASKHTLDADAIERGRADPADALEVAIESIGAERVAAFVAEPIIGASAGAVVPPDDYWPRVRSICDRYGVLLIADEVMSGMGRTGHWLALSRWHVDPDLVALGKGMGNGVVPLGGVGIREQDWRSVRDTAPGFPLGQTFSQHPVAAAAGRAALAVARDIDLPAVAATLEGRLRSALEAAIGDHPRLGELRGRGGLLAIELVADRGRRTPYPRSRGPTGRALSVRADTITQDALSHSIISVKCRKCESETAAQAAIHGRKAQLAMLRPRRNQTLTV